MNQAIDKKAQKILFDTYWSSAGWKSEYKTSPDDFNYALNASYMFRPVSLKHNLVVDRVVEKLKQTELIAITDAFLASLSTRRLDWRSALGSYAISRHFPKHEFDGEFICNICGEYPKTENEDISIFNFERLKWGGVRHLSPSYISFDLEWFYKHNDPQPLPKDLDIFKSIIDIAGNLPHSAKLNDLERAISKVLPSNKDERRILIQILGYCGILSPSGHRTFFDSFVNYSERHIPAVNKIDWNYPVCWWTGKDGIKKEALKLFFPDIPISL